MVLKERLIAEAAVVEVMLIPRTESAAAEAAGAVRLPIKLFSMFTAVPPEMVMPFVWTGFALVFAKS